MSFQALNAALTGLRVAQQQLTTISNNVSNATTPGYSRKILPQSTQVINSTGQIIGVQSETLIRKVDLNLEKQLWTQVSSVSAFDTTASYLDQIEKFHGATDKQSSISAQIAELKNKFAALSDSPSDGFLLQTTLNQATQVASKFNDFGSLITQLRNDAQTEIVSSVDRINDLVSQIASLNGDIKGAANLSRSVAGLEDQRDIAIKELSNYLEITSFQRGDGVIVVQSITGVQLADERPTEVFFDPGVLGATTTYPQSAAGIYIGGDPTKNIKSVDVTATNLGGKLGALVELRDKTLIQYQAQVDELAHKLALRLDSQGLRLFTDSAGSVPLDTPPDPSVIPAVPVTYVGFATNIQVNQAILNDVTLLQQGTYTSDLTIPEGSNEVVRRVIQFGFGSVSHQEAQGTTDLNIALPATDLQSWLGLYSTNNVVGGVDFSAFSQIDDGLPSTGDLVDTLAQFLPSYPANDAFRITFEEARLGTGPVTVNIDLSQASTNFPIGGPGINDALDQIIAEINSQITIAGTPASLAAVATRNTNGQLVIQSRGNVTLNATGFANAMGSTAFSALGFSENTYVTEDPYFDVGVGTSDLTRITIEPGDTTATLVNKLQYNPLTETGVPGLYVDFNALTGQLYVRPGIDDTNGGIDFGGDISLISGPGTTTGAINPTLAGLPQGVGVLSAIFGSYSVSGTTVSQTSPTVNVAYSSETALGSGIFVPFRRDYLGPEANVKTGIVTGNNVIDFSQKMVNTQGQDVILNRTQKEDATTLHDLLEERFLNETGVNIDEELSTLIVVQTAYAAAARAVTTASDMFDDLLNAIR